MSWSLKESPHGLSNGVETLGDLGHKMPVTAAEYLIKFAVL